jgi:hypothetical protein
MIRISAAALAAVLIGGAGGGMPDYQTVTWYVDHPAQMRSALQWCRDNAGLMPHLPTCINADEAQSPAFERQLKAHTSQPDPWLVATTAKICRDLRAGHVSQDALRINGCL